MAVATLWGNTSHKLIPCFMKKHLVLLSYPPVRFNEQLPKALQNRRGKCPSLRRSVLRMIRVQISAWESGPGFPPALEPKGSGTLVNGLNEIDRNKKNGFLKLNLGARTGRSILWSTFHCASWQKTIPFSQLTPTSEVITGWERTFWMYLSEDMWIFGEGYSLPARSWLWLLPEKKIRSLPFQVNIFASAFLCKNGHKIQAKP